ncbi:GNAT family N-acetyltransferase [Yoonia maritima]|uniref:GNAT family N-acetyltransferase n=1 Tax=Yoonia maritima TaxID=1435347 RepID=UPI000D10C46F|nr:GNAT family N-acetyltransferase [Yoonia maritima]
MYLPLQQHPKFSAALNRIGVSTAVINLPSAAPVQVIRRFGLNFAARGPIWHSSFRDVGELRRSRLRLVNSNGGDAKTLRAAGFRQLMTPAHVAELALNRDLERYMAPKWRNIWRRAQHSPLTIYKEPFNDAKHQWLLDADLAQQKQKRFRALPHGIIHAYSAIAPKEVTVWIAKSQGDIVAGMLFLRHGICATYHLGWSNDAGRKHAAHHRMLIAAAHGFADTGVVQLDLGTVDTHGAPGLARFKIGTGANIRTLGGSWLRMF